MLKIEREAMQNILSEALKLNDLDDAVGMIQAALGITDGGIAGQVFSGLPNGDESWATLRHNRTSEVD